MKIERFVLPGMVLLLLAACGGSGGGEPPFGGTIKVLSNRPDLISGGDALVEVVLPAGVAPADVVVRLNGVDVSNQFAVRSDSRYLGLLTGLRNGSNTLTATLPGKSASRIEIRNYPSGGPVIAGPQLAPWGCPAGAMDAQCNQPPAYSYFYISTDSTKSGFQPYDPASPATDVASTQTENGTTMPFIIRVETGYIDRDQYRIATLFQPGQEWTAWAPQSQFNHKLVITHGASCGVDYNTGTAPSVTNYDPLALIGVSMPVGYSPVADAVRYALGQGFIAMSNALDNSGHNCNLPLQAESLIMTKEHLIEAYGELRYAIGVGCSGGSLAEQWIANAYPGVYQGITPTCSFPDAWSTASQFLDYHLLLAYFQDPSKWGAGIAWTTDQMAKVEGHVSPANANVSEQAQWHVAVPTDPCSGISDAQRYDPSTNPGGVRCDIQDAAVNVFGRRVPADWSANETTLGHGFAGVPIDNEGVQYGLSALHDGWITPSQFVDVNARVGGVDIDTNPTVARLRASQPALANAYRSGMINETNNLDRTAIIDCRGPDPGAFHDAYRAFAVRARLDREHGGHGNQLIWEGPAPIIGDGQCLLNSFVAMNAWLGAVEADTSTTPLAQKIVADKPADLMDRCYDGNGNKLSDDLCGDPVVPVYGTPRTVAGDAISTDTNKCQLKPLDRADPAYGLVPFLDSDWAQLQALFPDGVCDFSKPGVSQQGTVPWLTYQTSDGGVVFGGMTLPPVPPNSGGGWASASFGT